ncbi:hypothetical protein F0235_15130 [Vibrio splendidus]|uniref:hypothetical protein n=1 Tax=Vibrio splendidus TaxID=29497 RepID=UPI00148B92A4|nr:hypothetical protein [Vibrio splendidus]NOI91768.1 hypothetical protein [Vibrio splendidus]
MLSKHMFHFALVHEQFAETGDLVRGLLPLFTPLLSDLEGKEFIPEKFCKEINTTYGLEMHPYVAEDLAPKLVEAGVLTIINERNKGKRYYIDSIPKIDNAKLQSDIQKIFNEYEKHAKKNLKRAKVAGPNVDYSNEFISRLVQIDTFVEKYDPSKIKKYKCSDILDYTFFWFVNVIEEQGGELKEVLNKAYSGCILSEVVLSIKEPSITNGSINGKNFYIDAPILLNILGFNDDYSVQCSRQLINKILEEGGVLTTTENYIDEAQTSIRIALSNRDRKQPRVSSLDHYLFKNPSKIIDVRTAQNSVKDILSQQYNFNVNHNYINISSYASNLHASALKEKLSTELSWYSNEVALYNDVESITYVVANHGYSSIKNIADSKSFLISPNESLIKSANKVLYTLRTFTKPDMTPLLSEKKLAVLLWVISGGVGQDITSLTLVSSCARAFEMHKEVFYKVKEFLKNLPEEKVRDYERIVCNDRVFNYLIDEVGSNYNQIDGDNFEELLVQSKIRLDEEEKLKEELYSFEKSNFEEKVRKVELERNKAREAIVAKSKDQVLKEKQNSELNAKVGKLEEKIESLERQTTVSKSEYLTEIEKVKVSSSRKIEVSVEAACKEVSTVSFSRVSSFFEKILRLVVSFTLALVCYKLSVISLPDTIVFADVTVSGETAQVVKYLISAIPFIATWALPDLIFGGTIKKLSDKTANKILTTS